jgi:DNA polymerase-3 subunit alpha
VARRREEELGISTLFSLLAEPSDGESGGGGGGAAFDDARVPIPEIEFEKAERLALEKEMLGLYVSDHPLMGLERSLARHVDCPIREMLDQSSHSVHGDPAAGPDSGGGARTVGGVVTSLSRRYTKRGELMATFVLEDLEAAIEVFVFPKTMQEFGSQLENDVIVAVRARLDHRDDQPKLIALDVNRLTLAAPDANQPVVLQIRPAQATASLLAKLKELICDHAGSTPVRVQLGEKLYQLPPEYNVEAINGFVGALKELLGVGAVVG